jgi:hypothetical protein
MKCTIAIAPVALTLFATIAAYPAQTAQIMAESGQAGPVYEVVADRVLGAPAILDATIKDATKLKPADAPNVAPGHVRFYVEADVAALIRGPAQMPVRISYLVDVPLDSKGKAPKLKKMRVMLFARAVAGRPGEVQLTSLDGQQLWTPALDALVRRISQEVVAPDAAPAITGIGNAFHVPGSLPGEGETQIFLTTADSRPVSLNILRRPGEQTRWAVALSEIVDEAAGPPARDTFLWYRLACGLPAALPDRTVESMDAEDATLAREDYAFVLKALGPCRR